MTVMRSLVFSLVLLNYSQCERHEFIPTIPKFQPSKPSEVKVSLGPLGLLLITYNGTTGTVCDKFFYGLDVDVACRTLGLPTEGSGPVFLGRHGNGGNVSLGIALSYLKCKGTEQHLNDCDREPWFNNVMNCNHYDDAGIKCGERKYPAKVKLTSTGLLLVTKHGRTGTVCNDNFDNRDARVICRMLGMPTDGARVIELGRQGRGGDASLSIAVDNLYCTGEEQSLDHCRGAPWWKNDCTHEEDVGVVCNPATFEISPHNLLLASKNGTKGTVCDDYFYISTVNVMCRYLGLPIEDSRYLNSGSSETVLDDKDVPPFVLNNLNCLGNETTPEDCSHSDWFHIKKCNRYSEESRMACTDNDHERFKEHYFDGVKYTFVVSSVTWTDAQTACRNKNGDLATIYNYKQAKWMALTSYKYGGGGWWLGYTDMDKEGNWTWSDGYTVPFHYWSAGEPYNVRGTEDCLEMRHLASIGSIFSGSPCDKEYNFVCTDGTLAANLSRIDRSGITVELAADNLVLVTKNNITGTICDDYFDRKDAKVICRMLGLPAGNANVLDLGRLGKGGNENLPIVLDDVGCNGTETTLEECDFRAWFSHDCNHEKDVGVVCSPPNTKSTCSAEEVHNPACQYMNYDDARRLIIDLDRRQVNNLVMPRIIDSSPVFIHVSFTMELITVIDPTNDLLCISGTLDGHFNNPYLSWDTSTYEVSGIPQPSTRSWLPMFQLDRAVGKKLFKLSEDIELKPNGDVIFSLSDIFQFTCKYDVYLFPFDSTKCILSLRVAMTNTADVIIKHHFANSNPLMRFSDHSEWNASHVEEVITTIPLGYSGVNCSAYELHIWLARRSSPFIMAIILPLAILMVISWLIFVLPLESGERVGLCVTILLAYTIFQQLLNSSLPKSEVQPAIGNLIGAIEGLSAMSLVCSIFILRVFHLADSPNPPKIPRCIRSLLSRPSKKAKLLDGDTADESSVRMIDEFKEAELFKDLAYLMDKVFFFLFISVYFIMIGELIVSCFLYVQNHDN